MYSLIPITLGHDYSQPIGYVDRTDGEIRLILSKEAKISTEMIERMNMSFAPTYQITKSEDNIVTEVQLLGFGLVPWKKGNSND